MHTASKTPFVVNPATQLPHHSLRSTRFVLLALLALALPACKIVVTVPFGGKVVTEDGFACQAGQSCEVEVSDATFDSTFKAVPATGYTFTRWRPKSAAFCGNFTAPCHLSTLGFDTYSALLDILDSDSRFFLEPVFVQYKLSYWQQVLSEIEAGTFTTDAFLYAIKPNTSSCDPGALTDAARGRALQAVNQVRSLHHLRAVTRDGFYDMQVQEASLAFVAMPYESYPYVLVSKGASPTPWSFFMVPPG